MSVKKSFTFMKGLNTSSLCFIATVLLFAVALIISCVPDGKLMDQQAHLAVRSIGDKLMKLNGDSSSPVPPVQLTDPETYTLKFEHPVVINPNQLVDLSLQFLNAEIATNSIINVRRAGREEVVYGFEIDHLQQKDIPCLGRTLNKSNYSLEFSFYDNQSTRFIHSNIPAISTASVSMIFAFMGFSLLRKKKTHSVDQNVIRWNDIQLDVDHNLVKIDNEEIQLTNKESQILAILLHHEGNLVTREHFIQEVWLKSGVVTERSLDMYISRLRKKTEKSRTVQIVNQHGKGYYLQVG